MPGPRLDQLYQYPSGWSTGVAIVERAQVVIKYTKKAPALPTGQPLLRAARGNDSTVLSQLPSFYFIYFIFLRRLEIRIFMWHLLIFKLLAKEI